MRCGINCWEYFKCGREPGGKNVAEMGVCPASTESEADGVNHGRNAGRVCWAVAGTFCGETVQGIRAHWEAACHECPFLELVQDEEGRFDFRLILARSEPNS